MDIYELLATFAGFLVIISGVPQAYRLYKTKHSKDVSLVMFCLFFTFQAIWLVYGIHLNDFPIIFSNAGALTMTGINIILILKYRNAKSPN